jgi:DNA repair exonuclease SbcCD ATPase subunit
MELFEVKDNLEKLKGIYQKEQGKREQLLSLINKKKKKIKEQVKEKETLGETLVLLQTASEQARNKSVETIEELVTKPLQYIFEDDSRFEVEMKTKGDNSSAYFNVITEFDYGIIKADPKGSAGGGKGDITSLSLLTTLNCAVGTKITAPLLLDEPSKYVSPTSRALNVGNFLRDVSVNFDKQIILSTHNHDISAVSDRAYNFELKDGVTQVKENTHDLETV